MLKVLKKIITFPKVIWLKFWHLKKRWKLLIIVVILVAWGVLGGKGKPQQMTEVATVTRQDLQKAMIRNGLVEAQGVVNVTPPASGVITELMVDNGQEVAEGDILFTTRSDATDAEKTAALASYLNAKISYEEAKLTISEGGWSEFYTARSEMMSVEEEIREYKNAYPNGLGDENATYQSLLAKEQTTRKNLNLEVLHTSEADTYLKAAEATYQAALASYNALAGDGTYASPIAGRVENLGVRVGEKVTATVGDKDGTPLFLIIPAGRKTISMQVGANDAKLLHVGQAATITGDEDGEITAEIVRVDKVGTQGESGLTFRVWLEVNDENDALWLGSKVDIAITTDERTGVLAVPTGAVKDGKVTLTNEKMENLGEREVQTGLRASGQVEIIEGLTEGESVLITY